MFQRKPEVIMQPIFIACMGGTGSSLLTKTLVACGMEPGNAVTYFEERWRPWTCQHDIFTALAHMYREEDNHDLKWRTRGLKEEWARIHADVPGSLTVKMSHILRRYVEEAERNNWPAFGIKDTRTTDTLEKWLDISRLIRNAWGEETIFVTTVRDPVTYIHRLFKDERFLPTKGEHLLHYLRVWEVFRYMFNSEKNTNFIAYPQAFEDGSIKEKVESLGLAWTSEAQAVYDGKKPTKITQELIDEFRETFTYADQAITKYNQLISSIGRGDCQISLK